MVIPGNDGNDDGNVGNDCDDGNDGNEGNVWEVKCQYYDNLEKCKITS